MMNSSDLPSPHQPIGLIAGRSRLPVLVAQGMRQAGYRVCCVGLSGQFVPELPELCDQFQIAGPLRVGGWGRKLKRMGVRRAVMVGGLEKSALLYNWGAAVRSAPDLATLRALLALRGDFRSHRLLHAVGQELARQGIELIDSTEHIADHLAVAGVMTRRKPGSIQTSDIAFAWPLLRELLRLDIGQAIAVRHGDVIAVEAIEGTDRMIERAGQLCRDGGWVLLKAARPGHDRRADVPTIGAATVENVHAAGGKAIAVAAGDVIIVDKPATLALADQLGVAIVGVDAHMNVDLDAGAEVAGR